MAVVVIINNAWAYAHNDIPYSAKRWQGITLVNLAKRASFTNILPSQIPDSLN